MADDCGRCEDYRARDETILGLHWLVHDLHHEIQNLRLELQQAAAHLGHDEAA